MATPSVSVSITSVDESSKKITYTVSYSSESHFTANEHNYYGYVNGTNDAYVGYSYTSSNPSGSTVSYQAEYDSYKTSKTISITYAYYKEYIVQHWDGTYSLYDSKTYTNKAEAESVISGLTGGSSLYVVSGSPASGYTIRKKNCTYTIEKSTSASYGTASATAYFTQKPSDPDPETPRVTHFSVYPSSMTLEIGKTGTVSYLIDVEPEGSNPSYTITSSSSNSFVASCSGNVITANSIGTVTITFECAGFTDTCVVTVIEEIDPEPEVYVTDIYFNANKYKLTVDGESCDCTYTLSLSETVDAREFTVSVENLNDSVIQIDKHVRDYYGGTITITPLSAGTSSLIISSGDYEDSCDIIVEEAALPMFEWDTYITRGMSMNIYNKRPAPVTASEWNRLVDLVNAKCNTSIFHVYSGDSMIASSDGNVRQVADALGVYVDSGDTITAQFFLDLRDAINAL